ncbi:MULTISPECIES: acyltransferase family protein [Gordonibacter]|uniref:Acyltransferase family protein n=1 Tax=Gordonibacter faecis TaxID=3047475 RepID=A0ABT7DJ99_9ACTN|nr:acyltransferase family protein [Gordonibacter sp. KGMB12511]MDJ1649604.1 acyltransferase family protein [Gordonibacter sp. KGMB12511]HIW76425.1 acetyltransferase [Candidatus Gordonibacter avicola]
MPGSKSRYIPALDGLRALAVLAVIAYHMHMPWAPGGLLGVTVFFVLSGYLITSLLLIEHDNTSTIDLPHFWLRRVRRLVPAIVFVVVCTAALCTLFNHELLTKMRPDVLPSLLFFNNWWQIFHDVSYFEALGSPSPLAHFWSLAIEEQFYLVWPVALLVSLKAGAKKTTLRNATLVLAALSALEMALLFDPTADPSRVYYGTDTRAFSLLIGAWLAFAWPSHQLGAQGSVKLSKRVRTVLDVVGVGALVGVVLMMAFSNGFSPFLYEGGLVLCSALTAVVIAVMVHPASLLGRAAGAAPLVWIGKRSYGIYLWHYPLLLLMDPGGVGEVPWWLRLVQVAVVFACAAFSYRFVEDPIRHGAIGRFVSRVRAHEVAPQRWLQKHAAQGIGCVALVLVAAGGLALVPPTSSVEGAELLKQEEPHDTNAAAADAKQALADSVINDPPADQPANTPPEKPRLDVLMIGDSVSVRAIPVFDEVFPFGAIDAAINRQIYVGREVYDAYKDQDIVGGLVVFALGTNGLATDEELDALVADVGPDKQIWFINTRSPRDWVQATNEALARAAERYENVHLIDWFAASEGRDELFDGDGTHLTDEGARFYIDLVREALGDRLPQHAEGDRNALDAAQEEPVGDAQEKPVESDAEPEDPTAEPEPTGEETA